MEAAAALRLNGDVLAGPTESEHVAGYIVVEAAAAAAVHHLDTDTNAAATDSENEKMRLVVEAAAVLHSIGTAFAESIEFKQAYSEIVVEAEAAHHSIGNVFAQSTEFEYADGRVVVGAAAAIDLDEDAKISAAATCALNEETNAEAATERPKRRDAMSESQENKKEKTSGRYDEIRGLVEERRNTANGEKHKLKELSKWIKKCIRERKRAKRQEKIQQILEEFRGIKKYSMHKN